MPVGVWIQHVNQLPSGDNVDQPQAALFPDQLQGASSHRAWPWRHSRTGQSNGQTPSWPAHCASPASCYHRRRLDTFLDQRCLSPPHCPLAGPGSCTPSQVSWRETVATAATTLWSNLLLWVAKESVLAPNVRFGDQNAELPGQFVEKQVV
jgi:hypothetical protein